MNLFELQDSVFRALEGTEQETLEISSGKGRGFSRVVPVVFEGAGVRRSEKLSERGMEY